MIEHQHEAWMLDASAKGGVYCRACGQHVHPDGTPLPKPPTMREQVLAAICSVRVPVTGVGLLYADNDGTMPIFSPDEDEPNLLADAVVAALTNPTVTTL